MLPDMAATELETDAFESELASLRRLKENLRVHRQKLLYDMFDTASEVAHDLPKSLLVYTQMLLGHAYVCVCAPMEEKKYKAFEPS